VSKRLRILQNLLALAASFGTPDTVAVRLPVGLVVDLEERESGTGVTELAISLCGALFGQDAHALHASTIRQGSRRVRRS
jgi:hypothetical protein